MDSARKRRIVSLIILVVIAIVIAKACNFNIGNIFPGNNS
jgi:hypothetical protein